MAVTTGRARRRLRIVVVVIIAATTITAIFVHIEPSLPAGSCVLIYVDIAIFPTQDNIIPIILPAGRIYTIYLVTKFGRVSSSTRSAAPADLHQPLLLLLFDITSFGLISSNLY
jgi:hypothetical protein